MWVDETLWETVRYHVFSKKKAQNMLEASIISHKSDKVLTLQNV